MSKLLDGKKVVCADDDMEILALVTRHIKSLGATVVEASDGEAAFEKGKAETPDLFILDVMMPGMSGWEVCRAIRDEDSIKGAGIIMLTGIGERLNEMTSPLYGADAHLDKPFDLDDLERTIEEVIAQRSE